MKKAIYCLMAIALAACNKENASPYQYSSESTIYSDAKTTSFREVRLLIDPYVLSDGNKLFVVSDTLKNVVITIDDKPWTICNSLPVDTTLFVNSRLNNIVVTGASVKYAVIAPFKTTADVLMTAGNYADLLNSFLTLEPGDYFCRVISFDIKQHDGTLKTIRPFIVAPLEVRENTLSVFVGEFEVSVN